ncbi:MAG: DUF72 domain-containing protein [Gemmatimonadetes bacterium]|nr:DUF72 domain-containing protein [Gemmatimonadota bacterium]
MDVRFRIGTQGWNYDTWSGRFYPPGTKSIDRLELYSRLFNTVEIDSTFYAMPPAGRFRSWYERTPPDFVFTAKLPREITHDARLVGVDDLLIEFCNRASELREKLGPLLVQLPPDMGVGERPAVDAFVRSLPRELDFAIEFRDVDWFDTETFDLLHDLDVALAVSVGPWMTTDVALDVARRAPGRFQYMRWLGSPRHQELNAGMVAARDADLERWAERILELLPGKPTVYAYFNNDYQGHSPESARRLQALTGGEPADPERLREQPDLFGTV